MFSQTGSPCFQFKPSAKHKQTLSILSTETRNTGQICSHITGTLDHALNDRNVGNQAAKCPIWL